MSSRAHNPIRKTILGLILFLSKGSLKKKFYSPLIDFKNMLIFHIKILMLDRKIQYFITQKLMVCFYTPAKLCLKPNIYIKLTSSILIV